MVLRFAGTIFTSATLLFLCQPLVARMVVPLLGGAPAVWIVCSLCFQTLLLAGYAYAHFVGTRTPLKVQVGFQLVLVVSVFFVMPIAVDEAMVQRLLTGSPTIGLLLLLLRTIGLPFFVLSTTSPLVQRWFGELGEKDPYYLYAASNAGSMLALLGYPLVVEPLFAVHTQARVLHVGWAFYTVLVLVCAVTTVWKRQTTRIDATPPPPQVRASDSSRPRLSTLPDGPALIWRERFLWLGLAFAPSSLLLGATEYVTTDVASVPLLWVLPLALYLASFIVAFAKKDIIPRNVLSRAMALVTALVAAIFLARVARPPWLIIGAHMLLLFIASVVCHRALALRRPHVSRLTEFYLLLSLGGVLGGAFNGLLAPFVFSDLVEYPIAIGLVCLGRAALESPKSKEVIDRTTILRDVAFGLPVGLVTFGLVKLGAHLHSDPQRSFGWMFAPPLVAAFVFSRKPIRYAVAIGGLLVAGMGFGGYAGDTLFAERNFFGVLKVTREREGRFQLLVYGRTMHGKQALDPKKSNVPLAYYHPTGPAGDVLGPLPPEPLRAGDPTEQRVGVIGLGIGSLAAYARSGEWTFFEINPEVVDIARAHFGYLGEASKRCKVDVEVGDARLRLKQGPERRFDVLVLDAFSSDAVPVHLVTREALAVYRRALRPGGLLLAHVSNDHVRLQPVFAALAREAGMSAIGRRNLTATDEELADGKDASEWVLLSESPEAVERIRVRNTEWAPLEAPASQSVWTDDFANVLAVMRF